MAEREGGGGEGGVGSGGSVCAWGSVIDDAALFESGTSYYGKCFSYDNGGRCVLLYMKS